MRPAKVTWRGFVGELLCLYEAHLFSGGNMAGDPERLERLGLASSFCLFDKKLRSTGNASIVWGLINVLLGTAIVAANNRWGAVSLLLGLALIAAGVYERTVRDPKVIIISAAMLGGLALWNFALVALVAVSRAQTSASGRILFWAIAQAWGSYATWKTYSTYKMLREKSDPLTVQQVQAYMDDLKKAKPKQSVDLVEFDVNSFLQGTKRYRLKPVEDLYLAARYKAQLGSLQLEELNFVPRREVTLTLGGEKWMSKKIRATVQLGPFKLEKVSITPEMAARINPAAQAMVLGGAI
jgi:hypothetical protein